MTKLGDICTIVSGSTPKSNIPEYWDGDVKWITPAELNEETYIINDSVRHITELGVAKTGLKPFPQGTVILSSRAPIGKTAIAGCEMYCNQGFKNLICSDKINPRYLYWFLTCNMEYLNSLGRGATFKEISKEIVANIEIPLPAIEQQISIAEKFERISEIIALRKEQLAKLDQLVKSRFIELFGDCKKQTSIKESGLTISDGNYSSKYPRSEEFVESGIPFIRANNLKNGTVVDEDMYFITPQKHAILLKGHLKSNDVLITTRGNIGQVAIVPKKHNDSNINAQIVLLRDENGRFVPQYLLWALQTEEAKSQYIELQTGTALKQLPVGRLEQVIIKEPPIELQEQFATFVEQTDKSKLAIQQSLDKLELLRKSLMQEYFGRGERDGKRIY